ncbi:TauD/TfdA family dioxygenase [Amycolatopsis samaneae]|uniref:TauD/TfdA family dioxygenase n=1 Tax=Amycolatopsis samaneae TaxID=664691 RepID=A0ABW5GKF0_9PSEU
MSQPWRAEAVFTESNTACKGEIAVIADRARVPASLASILAETELDMNGHVWARHHIDTARSAIRAGGDAFVAALARRMQGHGWAIAALPPTLPEPQLRCAAAGVLAAFGIPFFSIDGGNGLWLDGLSSPKRHAEAFGGLGAQAPHIDAPNVTSPPDYTALLMMRPDPADGGTSVLANLRAAVAELDDAERDLLRQKVFFEGRADGLHGVGDPLLPFPVLESLAGTGWIRWAGTMVTDPRNEPYFPVLQRFAEAIDAAAVRVRLRRGELLVVDQRRAAHGRDALGPQESVEPGHRRLLCQAKVRIEVTAPVQQALLRLGSVA